MQGDQLKGILDSPYYQVTAVRGEFKIKFPAGKKDEPETLYMGLIL